MEKEDKTIPKSKFNRTFNLQGNPKRVVVDNEKDPSEILGLIVWVQPLKAFPPRSRSR